MTLTAPHTVFLPDEAATEAFGAELAPLLAAPLTVYLEGGLGAGKTTFTRGLLRGCGHAGTVKSPTYALVESYPLAGFDLHHFDLYRFASPDEWEDAGLDEYFGTRSVCMIEWPRQGGAWVPAADITVNLEHQESGRLGIIHAHSPIGRQILEIWKKN